MFADEFGRASADERVREVAALLATGILRLRARGVVAEPPDLSISPLACLDSPSETSVTAVSVNGSKTQERAK